MTVHILNNFLDSTLLRRTLLDIPRMPFSRYDNPFERKSFLEDKGQLEPDIARAIQELTSAEAVKWVSRILDIELDHADWPHYGGVFVYDKGDYLKPHVDAGIHPTKGLRKVVTALLYLTHTELVMYAGTSCNVEGPEVIQYERYIKVEPNTLVLFTNTNYAWHGVPIVDSDKRIVITVSYLAPASFKNISFLNPRTRAYFARCKWEGEDTPELAALREQRASEEQHASVYRMENN